MTAADDSSEQHRGDDDVALTGGERDAVRRAKLAKTAAANLSQIDITAELPRMSKSESNRVHHKLKLRGTASAAATANAIRTMLARADEDTAAQVLHDCCHPAVRAASETGELSGDELAALLTGDVSGLGSLTETNLYTSLTDIEQFGTTAAMRQAVWATMAVLGHAGSIATLGWLIADPPSYWNDTQLQAAHDAWNSICERHPLLPATPIALEDLIKLVEDLDEQIVDEPLHTGVVAAAEQGLQRVLANVTGATSVAPGVDDAQAEAAASGGSEPLVPGNLLARCDRLEVRLRDLSENSLPAIASSLGTYRIPREDDLTALLAVTVELKIALTDVARLVGAETTPRDLAAARELLDVAMQSGQAEQQLSRIRRLTGLATPEYVESDAEGIRERAKGATGDTDPVVLAGLNALVTLIELGGSDPQQAIELGRVVSAGLPEALSVLMMTSTPGTVTIPGEAPAKPDSNADENSDASEPEPDDQADTDADTLGEAELAEQSPTPTEDTIDTQQAAGEPSASRAGRKQAADPRQGEPDARTREANAPERESADTEHTVATNAVRATEKTSDESQSLDDILAGLNLTMPAQRDRSERCTGQSTEESDDAPADPDNTHANDTTGPRLYTELLHDRQYALAYWLTVAEDSDMSVQAAHRLAAHAAALKTSAGSNAAAFAAAVTELHADALRALPGMQMLIYGASVRAGLLSPTAGAAGPLRDFTNSIVRSGTAVSALTDALLNAIYSGVHITPGNADAVAVAAEAESVHGDLAAAAATMLSAAPSRNIRVGAATDVWQTWMSPDTGYLGRPLSVVASASLSATDVSFVRDRIAELRSPRVLDQAIDRDTRLPRNGNRTAKRMEGRAREKLIDWAGDVTELLSSWVTVTENLSVGEGDSWMADPIAELRGKVNVVREQALSELALLTDRGSETRDAAVEAGLALLTEALDILAGSRSVRGAEISAERVLGGVLTLVPDLDLTATLTPRRPVTREDVTIAAEALHAGDDGWSAAFAARSARHDQVGTHLLIEALRPVNPPLAKRLTRERDDAVDAAIAELDERVSAVAARIDSDRSFGRLSVDDWNELSTAVRIFQPGDRGQRSDFDVMLADVSALEADRARRSTAAVDAARSELARMDLTAEQSRRVEGSIDAGDLGLFSEQIETLRHGDELPAPRDGVDHLMRFYPTFCDSFASTRPSVGQGTHPLITQLRTALESGRELPEGPLAEALATTGVDLSQVGPRAKTTALRLEQWSILSSVRSLSAKVSNIKSILEQAGFIFEKPTTPPARRGTAAGRGAWLDLHGVTATSGKALLPPFGSGMSPAGHTLRLLVVWRTSTARELVEMLREEPSDQSIIVLYFGTLDSAARRELSRVFRSDRRLATTVVIDEAAFAYLACQAEPSREVTMATLLPFTSASPFTPDVPGVNIRQEMFYGRSAERAKIIDMMGPCIVYGGRQLGKSALLLEASRTFDDGRNRFAIYESIFKIGRAVPIDAVWSTLWHLLAARDVLPAAMPAGDLAVELTRRVETWVKDKPGRQLLLLLDESDSFLDGDAEAVNGMFTHVSHFKELMERTDRAVKVVFAGLHQTARFERLANHPLAHFGDPVCVGPLAPQAAFDLLTRPLHALGFRFADRDHAARVLALANNQPALIQLFAAQLLRNLQDAPLPAGAPPQPVTPDDVERVWADESLRTSFRKRFDWTLNLDPRYKIIAYSVAFQAHASGIDTTMSPSELRVECEYWWPKGFAAEDVRTGEFRALLDECVDLGVLSYTDRGYRLRTPNVLDLLGTRDDVFEVLEQAESIDLPENFDGSLMRPKFGEGPSRAPLTSQQIADLLAARNQVRLVIGSQALTIERCGKTLHDENGHALSALYDESGRALSARREAMVRDATPSTLAVQCQQATLKAANRHALVIVDLKNSGAEQASAAWQQARELVATHSGGTLGVVLVSGASQAAAWLATAEDADTSSGLTELRRYDTTDSRLWLTETTLPFQDNATRAELLAATGGWPILLNKVADDFTNAHDGDLARTDPLAALRDYLAEDGHARALVTASGVRSDSTLSQAWDFLVKAIDGEDADLSTFADYLTMHADSGDPGSDALTPQAMHAAGYGGTGSVVDVLHFLGLISAADNGQFQLEPVMAAATRRVLG